MSPITHLIAVDPDFESHWPFVANIAAARWAAQFGAEQVRLVRTARGANQPALSTLAPAADLAQVRALLAFGIPVTPACVAALPALEHIAALPAYGASSLTPDVDAALTAGGVQIIRHRNEGFWGQTVAEFALGLTISALRRIPLHHQRMQHDPAVWTYYSNRNNSGPDSIGEQMCDDLRFTSGTIAGKRVRIAGAGNIGSRYASFCHALGADVAIWDPVAADPAIERAGARRAHTLERLIHDAEIFAPMMPLAPATRGIVTAAHINALPKGCLTVVVTRMGILDAPALRARVLANELALSVDVFDQEPLPLDDPLLGRDNVTHTPHIAGRTLDSNRAWVEAVLGQAERFLK
jgi:phosphoglycerate dehydrogenase-like enzyme